jgi:hypothetical protein
MQSTLVSGNDRQARVRRKCCAMAARRRLRASVPRLDDRHLRGGIKHAFVASATLTESECYSADAAGMRAPIAAYLDGECARSP